MKLKNLLRLFTIVLFSQLVQNPLQASHLYGGEMAYEYLGQTGPASTPFRYRITLKHYVSDVGNAITPNITFNYYNFNGTNAGTFIKSLAQNSTLSPVLPTPVPAGCITGLPPIRIRTFVQTIDLP